MKTELPVDGFASANELMQALQGTNGDTFWLAKAEGHWHGGIHLKGSISRTPGFRSMTDGHIVAYRLNDDYLKAPCGPKMLKFTSTFILIKSTCTPDADKPANALDFYTLWMQLSPLSKYGGDKPALVTASSLKVRLDSAENGWLQGGISTGYFTGEQLNRLEATIGLKGGNASAVIPSLSDITISEEKAISLAMKMKSKYAQIVVDIYPEVLNTHPHCQGAMLSLVINRGTSFKKPNVASRIEMKSIHDDFISGNLNNIPNQFRSMKRLWIGQGLDGLIIRREDEAKLFEEGLSQ